MLSGSEDDAVLYGGGLDEETSSTSVGTEDSTDSMALVAAIRRGKTTGADGHHHHHSAAHVELTLALDNFKRENTQLREKVIALKARETEMAGVALQLQQQWTATQNQISNIKMTLHAQLQSPVTEEEYFRIEQLSENDRDLVDAIKLGVYRQLGILKSSRDAALSKGSELAVQLDTAQSKLRIAEENLREKTEGSKVERSSLQGKIDELESRIGQVPILQQRLSDAEQRLATNRQDKEHLFEVKMELGAKSSECMRFEVALKELEERYTGAKTDAECAEQKLDILKAEYYDSKLQFNQRILELESQLRAMEDKMSMFRDLELEADIWMNNMAEATTASGDGSALALPFDVPASRRLQHSLSVTKRALSLENQLVAVKNQLDVSQRNEERLTQSLKMAQAALSDSGHPYALVEAALQSKDEEVKVLQDRVISLQAENATLEDKVTGLTADVSVLTRHRRELAAVKQALQQLPLPSSSGAHSRIAAASSSPIRQQHAYRQSTAQQHQRPEGLLPEAIEAAAPPVAAPAPAPRPVATAATDVFLPSEAPILIC